jgi:type I restriction enzyme, R subunit
MPTQDLHHEHHFESEICAHLAANGWLHDEGDAKRFDRTHGLYLPDLLAWIESTQPQSLERLTKTHGTSLQTVLAERIRKNLNDRGTLDVLRRGIDMLGLKGTLDLAQFKPALAMNPAIQSRYAQNRLRVIRQVRHSPNHPNDELDLVLFLNGIPVATAELKSNYTQSVLDAVDQYREDRNPQPKGGMIEPLLSFPGGALVHFAISQSEVMMSTRLAGAETTFLPFNKGNGGAAGNAPNPNGFATSYLWEEVWERESWLDILHRYLIGKRDDKKQLTSLIFPRYHQLDVTRKLVADVLANGPGQRYLIQHSAGSGKTNSIAWTAHFLADLHDADHNKLFDSVLVVSDRNVLDAQLREAIFDFERTTGVVETITNEHGSKTSALGDALKNGKKIIVCTIQTFPAAEKAVRELAATQGKRFAVIADEAHSSQSGEAAAKLKQVLSAEEWKQVQDGGEVDTQTILLAMQMQARAGTHGLTYIAFTATPKSKTLELFGRRDADGLPQAFHVYSMRQAIEEEFILDVLKNYVTYDLAFKLSNDGHEYDERQVERSAAVKGIMQWVRLHPYNIASKVQIVVEHYREVVQPLLDGRAKAMVVVGSRREAVRWQKAIRAYIAQRHYPLDVLVAFSGEVDDAETYPEPVTESSQVLNPGLRGRDIREVFKEPEYHLLLVANKFVTGFDQPLLCGMYVDKMLGGIQAVQTLSRLNRAYQEKGVKKDTTYILDFVNDPDKILEAFKTYYDTAELEATTDPHVIYDLRAKLDATGNYDEFEVDRVVKVLLDPNGTQRQLEQAIGPVSQRLLMRYKSAQADRAGAESKGNDKAAQTCKDVMDALLLFKRDMQTYVRVYGFLSQIFDYGNAEIEKRFMFYKKLVLLLEFGRERDSIDLSKLQLTHHKLNKTGNRSLTLNADGTYKLPGIGDAGSGLLHTKEHAYLEEIIEKVNGLFEGALSDGDQLRYVNALKGKLEENETLGRQAVSNSKEQFANSPDFDDAKLQAIMDALEAHQIMSTQALASPRVRQGLKDILLGPAGLYESLRAKWGGAGESPRT